MSGPLIEPTIIADCYNVVHCGKSMGSLPVAFFPCVCFFLLLLFSVQEFKASN